MIRKKSSHKSVDGKISLFSGLGLARSRPEQRHADNQKIGWLSVGQPDFQPLLRTLIVIPGEGCTSLPRVKPG